MSSFKEEFAKELAKRAGVSEEQAATESLPALAARAQQNYQKNSPIKGISLPAMAQSSGKSATLTDITDHVVGSVVLPKNKSQLLAAPPAAMANFQDATPESQQGTDIAQKTLDAYIASPQRQAAMQREQDWVNARQTGKAASDTPPKDETLERLQAAAKKEQAENQERKDLAADRAVYDEDVREISAMTDAERQQLKDYVSVRDLGRTENLITDLIYIPIKKRKAAGSLLDKYGESRLNELAETYARDLHQQERQEVQQAAQNASSGVGGAVLTTLGSIAAKPIGSVAALEGRLDELDQRTGRYSTLDPYSPGDTVNNFFDDAKQNVQKQIEGDGANIFRKGAAVLYQAGTGAVENVLGAITLGPGVTAAVNATGQLTRTISEASQRGATPGQAYLLAASSAALDYAMDKIPLDTLFGLAREGSTSALKAALKQAGIEATTEGASFIGSQLLDMAILQENSEYEQNIQNYMAQDPNMTYSDAKHLANKDLIAQAGQQLLVAGLSGDISAGVSTAIGNARNRRAQALLDSETDAVPDSVPAESAPEHPTAQPEVPPVDTAPDSPADHLLQNPQQLRQEPTITPEQIRAAQQERDIQAEVDRIRYEDQKSRAKARKDLQKDIEKTQADVDTGKGSPARLRQLQDKLYQMDMEEADYPRTRQEAITQQAALVDSLSLEQHDAYIRRETGESSNRPNKTATNRLKAAKAELDRLRNLSDSDYSQELADMGLSGNTRAPWLDSASANLEALGKAKATRQADLVQSMADLVREASIPDQPEARPESVPDLNAATDYLRSRLNPEQGQPTRRPVQPQQKAVSPANTVSTLVEEATTQRRAQQEAALQAVQDQAAAMTGGQEPEAPYTGTGNSASAEPSVGAADQNFTGTARYQELLSDDNVKPARRDDFRGDEVPEMDGSQRVSDVSKNLIGSKNTTDAAADQIKQLIDSGVFSYDPKSNKQSLQEAYDDLNARGAQSVRNDILRHLADNSIEDGDVTKAVVLANQYIQTGDETSAAEMMSDLSLLAQKSGRNLQLFSLIRRMTPEGQLDVLQKAADKMLSQGKQPKETRGKASSSGPSGRPKTSLTHADIPVELKNQYIEAARSKDSARIQAATEAIAQAVGSQYHATFKEKWDAWRYMCMLGNASTNVRNVADNAFMMPYAVAKDKLAAAFEKFLPQEQRTKAIHTDSDLLSWAKEDAKTVDAQNALKYSAKVGADVTKDILSENKQIFKSKPLEAARKAAEWAPSAGDMLFKNGYYERYLANFLTARGIKRADIDSGNVSPEILAQARQYAVDNAYVNTFNDRNNFSDAISSVGRWKASSNPVTRAFGTAIDGILPFRRTPANILVRFKEYSPVEILSAGIKLKYGKITASDFCNSLATGLTGSAAMTLGAALAHGITDSNGNGVRLISKATEDEKLQGKQDYSVEVTVNGKTYSFTVDWAAPANLPLFVGTNLYKAVTENGESGGDFVDGLIRVADASKDTLEPMLSLSCLSSVNDLLQNIKYSEDGSHIYKIAASAATSYLTQGIPSMLRQTGTFLQTEKQTTFANDDRKAVRDVQRTLSNVPFVGDALGLKTDKIDVWGNKVSTGTVGQRAFNAYLNPSKISKVTSDATTAELERLSKTEYGTGVVPEVAPKTITYTDNQGVTHKDVRLTAKQWEDYATTRGQTSKQILDKLVRSSDYAKLGDAGKAAAIDLVYKYADKTGAIKAMSDHDGYPDSWMQEAADSKNPGAYIIQKVNNQQMKTAMDNLTKAWAHNTDRPASKQALEAAYDAYSKSSADVKKAVMDAAEGAVKQYMEARADGFNSNVSLSIIKQVQSIPQKNRQKVAYQYQAVANTKGLSEAQLDKAMKLYMPDYDPSAKKPVKTEVKYDYIRQELGFSAKEYAEATYAMQDMSYDEDDSGSITKDEAVQAIVDLGFDKATATKFYQIYQGSSNSAKATLKKFIEENY